MPQLFGGLIQYLLAVYYVCFVHVADTYREKGGIWPSDPTHIVATGTQQAAAAMQDTSSAVIIDTFAIELKKQCRRMDPIPDEDWPPSIGRHESNLVMIEHGRDMLPGAKEAEEMQRDYVGGKVDRIVERKKEIKYEDIFDFKDNSEEASYDRKHFRMLIDGAPGVGKTTLCRKFCKDWGAGKILQLFSIVWLLNLREERIAKAKSIDDIFQHYNEDQLREIVQQVKKTGGEGNLLVCDGFDELSENERTRHSLFLDIIRGKELPNSSVIVTSRPYASQMLQQMKSITHHVEIVGFTEKQIKECIRRNITEKSKAEELIEQLKQRLDVLSLCYTPLNAAITLYVYKQEEHTLPTTLTHLYTLYTLHSLKRSVEIHFDSLKADDITDLKNLPDPTVLPFLALCEMAYNGLQDDQLGFNTNQLPQILQSYPGCKGTKPDLLGLMSGSKSFTGSNAEVSYQFTHLTVQEFLAAWYAAIVLSVEEQGKLFMEKSQEDRFRMMFLFLAGITGLQDTQAYQQIVDNAHKQAIDNHFKQQKLRNLLNLPSQSQFPQTQPQMFPHFQVPSQLLQPQLLQPQLPQLPQLPLQDELQVRYLFFLSHLIYESQNVSLGPILANAVQQRGKLKVKFDDYDLFQCTVVGYFLSSSNFPWKHLELNSVTDEQMEVMYHVYCEYISKKGAQNTDAANPPPFLKDTQELSLHYRFDDSTPPPKPISFSYLLNMKPVFLSVTFSKVATLLKYCSILFNVLTRHVTLQRLEIVMEECSLDMEAREALRKMLKTNSSLLYLKIGPNSLEDLNSTAEAVNINDVGSVGIFRALVSNTTLKSLCISGNKLQYNTNSSSNTASLLAQPAATPKLSNSLCQPVHDVGTAMADMLSHNSTLTELNVSECGLTPQSCASVFKALKHNSSLKKLDMSDNEFDQEASEHLADMLSFNCSLTELDIEMCDYEPKALARGLLHNTTLNKVTVWSKKSIIAAVMDLRKEEGHTQQPDPEVVRCENVLFRR